MSSENSWQPDVVRRLQDLLAYPREDMNIELKGWLDLATSEGQATLAKAILALANSGGGYLLIGIGEAKGSWEALSPTGLDIATYDQDAVNAIVQRFAEPEFHCEVHHTPHPVSGNVHPIVVVPGGHRVPIRAKKSGPEEKIVKKDIYYIRRPGPKSEAPQTGKEWDELIGRCMRSAREDLLSDFRTIMTGGELASKSLPTVQEAAEARLAAFREESLQRWKQVISERLPNEVPSRYQHGYWTAAYTFVEPVTGKSSGDLLEALKTSKGNDTGWPVWITLTRDEFVPYAYKGGVECLVDDGNSRDAAHSDFWRASPDGNLFLLRGYQEDSVSAWNRTDIVPGTFFDLTLPIWRIGECFRHAERLAKQLDRPDVDLMFHFSWTGLANRRLVAFASNRYLSWDRVCRQGEAESLLVVSTKEIAADLPRIVEEATLPLYESFEFFKPGRSLFEEELDRMRKGKW